MKKIIRIAVAALMICSVAACSQSGIEELNPQSGNRLPDNEILNPTYNDPDPFIISADVEAAAPEAAAAADTRVSAEDDGSAKIVYKWQPEDIVIVTTSLTDPAATAWRFKAINISEDGKTAMFQAPDGYPKDQTPALALKLEKAWKSSSFSAKAVEANGVLSTSTEELADAYRLYAYYDAEKKNFIFKQLLATMRFELTLPSTETAINSFRLQINDGTETLSTAGTQYDLSEAVAPKVTPANKYFFAKEELNIKLDEQNKAVLYLTIAPTDLTGKTLEIIVNKTLIATQACKAITIGKVASLRKTADKWSPSPYSAGIGSETIPYIVSNETNLQAMATTTNAGNTYAGKNFLLENDIAITTSAEKLWTPIGNINKPFSGIFDGNSKTISGALHLADVPHTGLFGVVSNATVSNLTLTGDVTYSGSQTARLGSIVGYAQMSSTKNCTHNGSLNINSSASQTLYLGGIVGYDYNSSVEECTQFGEIIKVTANQVSELLIGGIIGHSYTDSLGSMDDIHLSKNASPIEVISAKTTYIGAVAGGIRGASKIYTCCSYDSDLVTITHNGSSKPVALVVYYQQGGTQAPCDIHPFGEGTGTQADPYIITNEDQMRNLAKSTVEGTNFAGNYFRVGNDFAITSTAEKPWQPVSGFAGNFDGNNKTITQNLQHYPAGTRYCGLFGVLVAPGKIANLNVGGTVTANIPDSYLIIGAICGVMQGTIENCTSTCNVTATNTTVNAEVGVGGIIGSMNGKMIGCKQIGGVLTGSLSQSSGGAEVGGLVGYMAQPGSIHSSRVEGGTMIYSTASNNVNLTYPGALVGFTSTYGGRTTIYDCCSFSGDIQLFKNGASTPLATAGTPGAYNANPCTDGHTVPAFIGGGGTEANPYILASQGNLDTFAKQVNAGNQYEGKFFALENNITMTTTPEKPFMLGGGEKMFRGTFDGRNKTISGTIYLRDDNLQAAFIPLLGGTLKNLTLSGDVIYTGSKTRNIGAMVGFCNSGQVLNCKHIGSLNVTTTSTEKVAVGGVVALHYSSIVDQCTQTGGTINVSAVNATEVRLGGVSGFFDGASNIKAEMHRCLNETPINLTNNTTAFIGAVCGRSATDSHYQSGVLFGCCSYAAGLIIQRNGANVAVALNGNGTTTTCSGQGH